MKIYEAFVILCKLLWIFIPFVVEERDVSLRGKKSLFNVLIYSIFMERLNCSVFWGVRVAFRFLSLFTVFYVYKL